MQVASWKLKLQVANLFYELQVIIHELWVTLYKLKIKVANLFYELQVMALFHFKKKFTKHSEDCKSLLPV